MNCEFCKKQLTPYLLKQMSVINEADCYEVECPHCNEKNTLTRDGYLRLKEDWIFPKIHPLDNKLPSEMNVIFCSLERCGISWVIRALSEYHKAMFGVPIVFTPDNAEVSPLIAKSSKRSLHLGWNNVYNVDPQELLDKIDPQGLQYDRVVVIQRKKDTLLKAQEIYWKQEGIWDEHLQKLKNDSLKMYDIVYREDIEDHRYKKFYLEDLNQYPTSTLNELMDFLNFPKMGRPPVVDFKPQWFERNWEAISSIYEKGYTFTKRLGRIQDHFRITKEGFLEYLVDSRIHVKPLKNVVIIGPGLHKGCHLSENLYYAFKEKGIRVQLIDLPLLGWGTPKADPLNEKREMYLLSKALEKAEFYPDLVVFDEPFWYFINDVAIPVFYFHRDFMRNPTVYYPTQTYFWHQEVVDDYKSVRGHPYWANKAKVLKIMPPAMNPSQFDITQQKTIKGVCCLAGRESMKWCLEVREHKAKQYNTQSMQEIIEFIQLGLNWIENEGGSGLTDEQYRELLPQCEAMWLCFPLGQYISRRIFEAMYCKVVCIIKLENKVHEAILRDLGFIANEHYISIDSISDIVEIQKKWDMKKYKEMVENAHEVVVNNHLFKHRVEFIEEEYLRYMRLEQ